MVIMPSNNTGKIVMDLFDKYPNKLALMLNPHRRSKTYFLVRNAIDNAAFSKFDQNIYFDFLNYSKEYGNNPMFVVCPDVVGCHDRTLALWNYYYKTLKDYDYQIAFVAQDGCTPDTVPDNADWIFIGGKDPWKMDNIKNFVGLGKPVHVGRVNGIGRLKYCESLGVDSVDGTGWMRARDKQFYDFLEHLEGEKQCSLF